jgi:tRNA threonylcarbamoyladenosine biosynthesis protein TsaB
MPRILLIETSSRCCSVALACGGDVVVERSVVDPQGYRHAELLHPMISEVLKEGELAVRELDALGVAHGPGSYTGLRIGLAAAKGLALPWALPCYGVSSLELLAEAAREAHPQSELPVWAAMDARRMEVYEAFFTSELVQTSSDQPSIADESWAHRPPALGAGDGIEKIRSVWPGLQDSGVKYAEARHALRPVQRRMADSAPEDLATWEPRYLKVFGQVL